MSRYCSICLLDLTLQQIIIYYKKSTNIIGMDISPPPHTVINIFRLNGKNKYLLRKNKGCLGSGKKFHCVI